MVFFSNLLSFFIPSFGSEAENSLKDVEKSKMHDLLECNAYGEQFPGAEIKPDISHAL
jgi:hypothetical protein